MIVANQFTMSMYWSYRELNPKVHIDSIDLIPI